MLAVAVFLWFALSGGKVFVFLGIPGPGLLMFGVGLFGAAVLLLMPNIHRRLRVLAGDHAADLYAVGATPFTNSFVVVAGDCIVAFDRRGSLLGTWGRETIDAIALKQFGNAVSMVLFIHDRCFELSVSSKVGGPAAPVWSFGGALGQTDLRMALERSLRRGGYRLTTA